MKLGNPWALLGDDPRFDEDPAMRDYLILLDHFDSGEYKAKLGSWPPGAPRAPENFSELHALAAAGWEQYDKEFRARQHDPAGDPMDGPLRAAPDEGL